MSNVERTRCSPTEAAGAVEFQEDVELVDVHVPLFAKDDDDDKKQLLVEARDVPLGIAEIAKRYVNITIIKDHGALYMLFIQIIRNGIKMKCEYNHYCIELIESPLSVSVATTIFSFLQPKYTYSRKDGQAKIPISREIIEDGRSQITYNTQDLTAKNKKVS